MTCDRCKELEETVERLRKPAAEVVVEYEKRNHEWRGFLGDAMHRLASALTFGTDRSIEEQAE